MMAPSTSLPKGENVSTQAKSTWLEKTAAFFESVRAEGSVRLEKAKAAFGAELAWQAARRMPPAPPVKPVTLILAGIAVDVETGACLALQEGLNVFGKDSLRVDQGRVEGSGSNAGQSYWTNDTVSVEGRTYVLKLFPTNRFSRRIQRDGEVL